MLQGRMTRAEDEDDGEGDVAGGVGEGDEEEEAGEEGVILWGDRRGATFIMPPDNWGIGSCPNLSELTASVNVAHRMEGLTLPTLTLSMSHYIGHSYSLATPVFNSMVDHSHIESAIA